MFARSISKVLLRMLLLLVFVFELVKQSFALVRDSNALFLSLSPSLSLQTNWIRLMNVFTECAFSAHTHFGPKRLNHDTVKF